MKAQYGITYSETTPESAENGDFSDTGWEREYEAYEHGDLRALRYAGFRAEYPDARWFSSPWEWDCRTGTQRSLDLHFQGVTPSTLNRIGHYLDSKPVLGGKRA